MALSVLFQRSGQLAAGRSAVFFHLKIKYAMQQSIIVRRIPGKKPAKKRISMGAPVNEANRTQKILGGMRLPNDPEAHNRPSEYLLS